MQRAHYTRENRGGFEFFHAFSLKGSLVQGLVVNKDVADVFIESIRTMESLIEALHFQTVAQQLAIREILISAKLIDKRGYDQLVDRWLSRTDQLHAELRDTKDALRRRLKRDEKPPET